MKGDIWEVIFNIQILRSALVKSYFALVTLVSINGWISKTQEGKFYIKGILNTQKLAKNLGIPAWMQ